MTVSPAVILNGMLLWRHLIQRGGDSSNLTGSNPLKRKKRASRCAIQKKERKEEMERGR